MTSEVAELTSISVLNRRVFTLKIEGDVQK